MLENSRKSETLINIIKVMEDAAYMSATEYLLGEGFDSSELDTFYDFENENHKERFKIALNVIEQFEEASDISAREYLKGENCYNEDEINYLLSEDTYEEYLKKIILNRSDFIAETETDLVFHIELGDNQDVESFETKLSEIETNLNVSFETIPNTDTEEENAHIGVISISFETKEDYLSNIETIYLFMNKIDQIC